MKPKAKKNDSKEIEQIRRLKELEGIIKKSDIENAFVSTASKDSESVSSNISDTIINRLAGERINEKELTLIEQMTTKNNARHAAGAPQARKSTEVHMVKAKPAPKPSRPAPKKAAKKPVPKLSHDKPKKKGIKKQAR
jgi:hypothetical protein